VTPKITILPDNTSVSVRRGTLVREALERAGIAIIYPCGGKGRCGQCRIRFAEAAPKPGSSEQMLLSRSELKNGYRLACRAKIERAATISVPQEVRQAPEGRILSSLGKQVDVKPLVRKIFLILQPATIQRQHSDYDLIHSALRSRGIPITDWTTTALQALPSALRRKDHSITVTLAGTTCIAAEAGDTSKHLVGCAVDIGTTTVAAQILDLNTGKERATVALLNPQSKHGADVISRIQWVRENPLHLRVLQEEIVACINRCIEILCKRARVEPGEIFHLVAAGNATMTHLFLGVTPEFIGVSPYVSAIREGHQFKTTELGIRLHPEAIGYTLPNIGGFVGGDTVADMLVAAIAESDALRCVIDIGTNGEVVIGNGQRLLATSAAAGPAFEGAQISHGMQAGPGAIDGWACDSRLRFTTVGDRPAAGICGSGLVDIVAELLRAKGADASGRLQVPKRAGPSVGIRCLARRIEGSSRGVRLLVASKAEGAKRNIYFTQNDVRQLQLAKGAIATAIELLLMEYGAAAADIQALYLAGAFGNYIRKNHAQRIGLIPQLPLDRIHLIGDAALEGAKLVLLNTEYRDAAERIARQTEFIELAGRADFQDAFAANMSFPSQ
jgi:uncharacterized 2Fe-2S/4Fe-4S cluster protein (DUF4445 family)